MSLLAVLALTVFAYHQVLAVGWVYEDAGYRSAPLIWTVPSRALTIWSLHLTGDAVGLAHALNLCVHLVNGLLLYALGAMLVSPGVGLVAAAILLWLPLSSEAVVYLSARGELLVLTCTLIAILAAVTWTDRGGLWRLGLLGGALVGAAGSKEIGLIAAPLVVLTLWTWRGARMTTRLLTAGLGLLLAALLASRADQLAAWVAMAPTGTTGRLPWGTMVSGQLTAWWRLLLLIPFPIGLSIDHDVLPLDAWRPVAVLGTLLLGTAALVTRRRTPVVTWTIGWLFLGILPRLVVPTGEWVREYQLYPSLAGVALGVPAVLSQLRGPAWLMT